MAERSIPGCRRHWLSMALALGAGFAIGRLSAHGDKPPPIAAPSGSVSVSWREALTTTRFVSAGFAENDPNPATYSEPTDAQLRASLLRMHSLFGGLVFYATSPFTLRVIREASTMKFRSIVLGVWNPRDQAELRRAVEVVKQYPGLACACVVGNEGLLRNSYGPQDLEKAAAFLHEQCPGIALTTSEPVDSYGDRFLLGFGDKLLAPNIHPWFANHRDPEQAVAWVIGKITALRKMTGDGVFIWVHETGLPSGGDPQATPLAQAQFWTELTRALPALPNVSTAYFEHQDLPWKARSSGLPIEKTWGFWDASGKPKQSAHALAALWNVTLDTPPH